VDAVAGAGFTKEQLVRVLLQDRKMLTYSLDGKLQPVLAALEGVLGSRQAVVEAVSKAPSLIGSSLNTLASNVRVLAELGLTVSEISLSVNKQPQLFYKDYLSPMLKQKLHYFEVVLGRCPRDMFRQYESYLMSGLHKIDYRVSTLPVDCFFWLTREECCNEVAGRLVINNSFTGLLPS